MQACRRVVSPMDATTSSSPLDPQATSTARVAPPPRSPRVDPFADPSVRSRRRIAAAMVFAASAGLLGVAAWLTPEKGGMGTHLQLGLPPCGWITGLQIPCPTCGMTTAFAAAAEGNLLASLRAQPFGCLLALATAVTAVVAAQVLVTGSALGGHMVRLFGPRVGWTMLVLALLGWAYKIAAFKMSL